MDPFEAIGAVSEGVNVLYALLEWNDAGAIEAPPFDGATLATTMKALEEAMREVLYGGRIVGGEKMVTEEGLVRVLRIEEMIPAWPSRGALSPELVTLAQACLSGVSGGMSWREMMAHSRRM
ncbi:MAG: hypothetical protein ABI134_28860 [Byssovorax sp.]